MADGERRMAEVDRKDEVGTAESHTVELTVWDVPSAAVAGERFVVAVGAKCSAGCDLGGRELSLFDHARSPAGTVKLGHDVWPETEALYFAEVEARAPIEAGSHQWEAKMAGRDGEPPHAAGSFALLVRVVAAPDCEVTIKAVDRDQAPIKGARVVMHPYRAVTDDSGIAKVKVARGRYDILVSGSRCLPSCTSVDVTADMVAGIELDAEPSIDEVLE
jgi:hypothetical protein